LKFGARKASVFALNTNPCIPRAQADDMVSTKDAKKEYFLAADDLSTLTCDHFGGGIGIGPPTKYYRHEELVDKSLAKHSRAGVVRKLEARHKREEKKRMKEERAEEARKRMKTITNTVADGAAAAAAATTIKASADTQEIKKLRGGLLKMTKKSMGFQMSGAPKNWRIELPGTSKATFAALMGRPTDVDLDSFVKNGAYYTERYEASKLFGTEEELTKDFNREGVTQKIGSTVTVHYKPSTLELSVSGYAEMHSSITWFGW
jgi:outer membrane protein assembly factor BamE (lipoprotein component of BamABCDE complex)